MEVIKLNFILNLVIPKESLLNQNLNVMKFFILTFLLFFYSCKKDNNNSNINFNRVIKSKNQYNEIKRDTFIVDNFKFILKQFKEENLDFSFVILNQKLDTIYKHNDFIDEYKIIDFNDDGYQDIELNYITHIPGIIDVLLFDIQKKEFSIISKLQDFPGPQKIEKSNYYYSYHGSGCADYNWDSDLFYISNNKCFKIGNISGRGCGYEKRNGIFINKILNEKEVEINCIKRDSGYYNDKWKFIENYWNKNYLKFAN